MDFAEGTAWRRWRRDGGDVERRGADDRARRRGDRRVAGGNAGRETGDGITVATAVALLDHVNVAPTGCPSASAPVAVNCCVRICVIVAEDGATVIVASGPATMPSASLHAPNVFAAGARQTPVPSR